MSTSTTAPESTKAAVAKGKTNRAAKTTTQYLPTNRIAVPKQIEILRAYAASSESLGRPVTNGDVGSIVDMSGNTVSLANAFFVATGFLERSDSGSYAASAEVKSFLHAHTWNENMPARKLAPLLRKAWFTQVLMPKLRFRPIEESEAITDLAAAAQAGPEYKTQLRMLLEYLEAAGIVTRENGTLRLSAPSDQNGNAEAYPEPKPTAEQRKDATANGKPELATSFVKSNGGAVDFAIQFQVNMQELSSWSADRLTAFFKGIAMVLAAKNAKEMSEVEKAS